MAAKKGNPRKELMMIPMRVARLARVGGRQRYYHTVELTLSA
ncbi:hypothetical protein F383_07919 [Gossypium arboreum]|uniref:Uncharacterized protein n=1 Tax=Gossypium arboreum TaxID=29729 RepID=A0A0B0NC97_GOSAR|nr:hypothetical protein F383_07919 [Gossypium arboreum]